MYNSVYTPLSLASDILICPSSCLKELLSDTCRCPGWPESTPSSAMAKGPHTLARWLWYKVVRHRQDLVSTHVIRRQWEGEVWRYRRGNSSLMHMLRWQDVKAQIRWCFHSWDGYSWDLAPGHGSGFGSLIQISVSHGNIPHLLTSPFSGHWSAL